MGVFLLLQKLLKVLDFVQVLEDLGLFFVGGFFFGHQAILEVDDLLVQLVALLLE